MAKQEEDVKTEDWVDELVDEVEEEAHAEDDTEQTDEETSPEDEPGEELAATDDTDEEPEGEKPDEDRRFKGILSELQAERQKRQELEQRMQKYDALWQKLEDQEKEEKEEVPDFEYDPTANLDARLKQTEELTRQQQAMLQQQQQLQALGQAVQAAETSFVAEHPDYYDALNTVREVERKKLEPFAQAQGWTDAQINQYLAEQELAAAAQLIQTGVNPAEYAYRVAQTYGYQPQKEDDAKGGKKGDIEDKLDRMEKGLKMSRTPSAGEKLTKDKVDSMSLHEFEEAMAESFGTKH